MTCDLVLHPQSGGLEPLAFPEGAAAGVGVEDGEVQARDVALAGEGFGMGEEGPAMARALRPRAKEHEAQIGVAGLGEAIGKLGDPRQAVIDEEAQPVALGRVAVRRRVGEELLGLVRRVDATFGQEPVIRRLAVELGD